MPARVSFYRPTGQSRRQSRPAQDNHDVFEGLPVRRWIKQWVPFGRKPLAPPAPPELPLPKESHLLTPMSQALLQAARAGTLDKPKQQAPEGAQQGQPLFLTRRWVLPRHMEPHTEPSYLGKMPDVPRRRRRMKKRVEGKIVITYLDEGGEVSGQAGGAAGPGGTQTVAAPVPTQRRRQPPKRKAGRGRKPGRKVKFAEGGEQGAAATGAATASGDAAAAPAAGEEEVVKVIEVADGQVELMELDKATVDDGNIKNEIAMEIEKREEQEEREVLQQLGGASGVA